MELDRRTNSKAAGGGMEPTVRVSVERPSPTVTGKGSQWVLTQKAPGWCYERPSTAVMGDRRVPAPGYRGGHDDRETTMMADAVKVELWELARLQDFPDDYPFQGNRTSVARQIGNACPATLAAVVVDRLVAPSTPSATP